MIQKQSGFTLIELMITIAVFAVLAAIATPNAISWIRNSQFNAAVRDVKAAVEDVRMYAMKSNSESEIEFPGGGNGYPPNQFTTTKQERGGGTNRTQTITLDGEITLGSSTNPIEFNSRGMVAVGGTVTIQNNAGLCRRIVIAMPGSSRITTCP